VGARDAHFRHGRRHLAQSLDSGFFSSGSTGFEAQNMSNQVPDIRCPTPYPELNQVLHEMVTRMQAVLGDSFVFACLQGSFAVGDFDRHSDVDWIVAVQQELNPAQVEALQAMHGRIFDLDSSWARHLEGSYFPQAVLRDYHQRDRLLWYLDNGHRSLIRSDHCNTALVRWVVRERGVPLFGPEPATLIDAIPVQVLRREMLGNMLSWGQQILADPTIINNRFYQTFAVLHYCRALHDLHNGFPGSKRAGAEWAKANLDPRWAGLIDRTWDGRPIPEVSVRQPADPQDLRSTLEFIRYVMDAASQYAESLNMGRGEG
jgi:hypothetical protein